MPDVGIPNPGVVGSNPAGRATPHPYAEVIGANGRIVAALLNGGTDVYARNPSNGNTALMLAANAVALDAARMIGADGIAA